MSDIREELADWIDTDVIAEHILDGLKEQGGNPRSGMPSKFGLMCWIMNSTMLSRTPLQQSGRYGLRR